MELRSEISGATRVFGVIADPISQVKAPGAINTLFAAHREDCVLVPFHVLPTGLGQLVDGLRGVQNLGGFVVTVPHKTAVVELCDTVSETARLVGAANVVTRTADGRLHAHNLDGEGFVAGLRLSHIDVTGMSVYLAGAGGAANAIAFALAAAGVRSLTLYNRTASKAQAMAERLRSAFPELAVMQGNDNPAEHELVVNTTSLGMRADDPLPFDASQLEPGQTVAEIIMQPAETALLQVARQRGCAIQYGVTMLEGQVDMIYQTLQGGSAAT